MLKMNICHCKSHENFTWNWQYWQSIYVQYWILRLRVVDIELILPIFTNTANIANIGGVSLMYAQSILADNVRCRIFVEGWLSISNIEQIIPVSN